MSLAARLRDALERGQRAEPRSCSPATCSTRAPAGDHAGGGAGRDRRPARADRDPDLRPRRCASIRASQLPGGRIDPGDDGPVAAALREAEEEIGLPPRAVEVIGIADRYRTDHRLRGHAGGRRGAAGLPLSPHPGEVAAMFEAPLPICSIRAPDRAHRRVARPRAHLLRDRLWEGRRIWGATAAMIVNLSRRLELAAMKLPRPPWQPSAPGMKQLLARSAPRRRARPAMSAAACATPCSASRSATSISPPGSARGGDRAARQGRIKAVPTGLAHGTITAVSAARRSR
jgi:hypothetical protein